METWSQGALRWANTLQWICFLKETFWRTLRSSLLEASQQWCGVVYIFSVVGWLIVVNASLLSLHSKQQHTKQSFCWKSSSVLLAAAGLIPRQPVRGDKNSYLKPFFFFYSAVFPPGLTSSVGTLFIDVLLICSTALIRFSWSGESRPHGRRHCWKQGIPIRTTGIFIILRHHLGSEATEPSCASGRRSTPHG